MSRPWFKFYPSAWRSEPALRICSGAARGLWIEMLCLMHEASPRGFLLINGRPPTEQQLAGLYGVNIKELVGLSDELETTGVFSRDDEGTIFSRRMVRDEEIAERDKANGRTGGNPSLKPGVNPPDKAPDKAKILETRVQNKERKKRLASLACATDPQFEEFWKAYPRRGGGNPKPPARIAFRKAKERGVGAETIIAGAIRYGEFVRAEGQEYSRFIPMQATWINDQGWENEYVPERKHQNGQDKSAAAAARRLHERVREWSGETDGEIRPVLAITGK